MSLDNPWVQSIGGGLIVAFILSLIGLALKRRREALFSIAVSTIVFAFGNILEPAAKLIIEGLSDDVIFNWSVTTVIRERYPSILFTVLFIGSFIPGIITGLLVLKARSFQQRIACGAFWAVVSLTLFDALIYYSTYLGGGSLAPKIVTWSNIYFSLISDIFGGAIGGVIIGSLLHFFIGITPNRRTPETETAVERTHAG